MKKKVLLAGALIALMTVGAFAQYNAESDFTVTKTASAVTITKYVGNQSISTVNIPPKIQNLPVTTIAGNAFTPNGNITSVTIPNSVTSIQATAFYQLASLRSVTFLGTIPSRGLAERAFSGNLDWVFYATDKNNGTPGTYTKNGETWTLTPAAATATTAETPVTSFEWSKTPDGKGIIITEFIGDETAVRIPDRISNLPVVRIEDAAFILTNYPNRGLIKSVVIPNTVTYIGKNAFQGCGQITSVTLPSGLIEIGNGAFVNCRSLTSITFPASLKTIGNSAFQDCLALTAVTIPASVTKITFGTNVFLRAAKVDAASKTALQKVGYTGAF